ncbi:RNA-binding domain-containing protein [Basidiobolus meristosporus CBS 931.73]|uniref:RNA-binding domain-containing protein n=1 Tax=Basidiobolus meristosporus CBS 931.73 TaxID=1314790 RepID=A0A1Y1XT33_9FUNG|nr:RNA-binding domain-containing protein [Basidiobolus meristosporus CBS 931.73]|eukprot:ORX88929.1 RNA-binding domain-containing protein [Basidiobolus meristosporus CBS 931.73]
MAEEAYSNELDYSGEGYHPGQEANHLPGMGEHQYSLNHVNLRETNYYDDKENHDPNGQMSRPSLDNTADEGKVFIGGLNWETSDATLQEYFSKYGEITDCVVMRDSATGRSRGFGFLTFADPRAVDEVLKSDHHLDGKLVDPKRAIPRDEQEKTEKIFVGGIAPEVQEDEFRAFFEQFGRVIDATLMTDRETGRPRGFGFITFESSDGVDRSLQRPDLAIQGKMVEVKRAMPKHKTPGRNGQDMYQGGGRSMASSRGGRGGYDQGRYGYGSRGSNRGDAYDRYGGTSRGNMGYGYGGMYGGYESNYNYGGYGSYPRGYDPSMAGYYNRGYSNYGQSDVGRSSGWYGQPQGYENYGESRGSGYRDEEYSNESSRTSRGSGAMRGPPPSSQRNPSQHNAPNGHSSRHGYHPYSR